MCLHNICPKQAEFQEKKTDRVKKIMEDFNTIP